MGSTFYTELRTSAYVVEVQRDAFYGLAKGVTAPNLAARSVPSISDVVAPVLPSVVRVGRGTSGA